MSNAIEFRIKRDNCKEAYLNGKRLTMDYPELQPVDAFDLDFNLKNNAHSHLTLSPSDYLPH